MSEHVKMQTLMASIREKLHVANPSICHPMLPMWKQHNMCHPNQCVEGETSDSVQTCQVSDVFMCFVRKILLFRLFHCLHGLSPTNNESADDITLIVLKPMLQWP